MRYFGFHVAFVVVLAACASSQPATTAAPDFQAPNGRAACLAAKGQWTWPGMPGQGEPDDFQGMCIVELPDAGKHCTSSSQCIGTCRAIDITGANAKGVCSTTNYAAGCFTIVEEGIARETCAD
jgi:hypothetical protein